MKKAFLIFVGGVLPLLCAAAPPLQNTIKMVTYFPASYASYQRLYAVDQSTYNETLEPYALSVGLSTDPCKLGLGCNQDVIPLQLKQAILVQKGNLYLNGRNNELIIAVDAIITGPRPTEDPTGANKAKTLNFKKNLRLGGIGDEYTQSLTATNAVMNELRLFNKNPLAPCSAVADSNGKMSWKSLTVKGSAGMKGMFLTCGGGQTCSSWKWHYTEFACGGDQSSQVHDCYDYNILDGTSCSASDTSIYNSACREAADITCSFSLTCDCENWGGGGGGGGDTPGTGSGTITPGHDNNN